MSNVMGGLIERLRNRAEQTSDYPNETLYSEAADELTALMDVLTDARACLIDHLRYMKEPASARIIKRIDAHLLAPESDNG